MPDFNNQDILKTDEEIIEYLNFVLLSEIELSE